MVRLLTCMTNKGIVVLEYAFHHVHAYMYDEEGVGFSYSKSIKVL
jgi:hypothetical protein